MSLRIVVSCDSDPAPYAGGENWPCRAWLTVPATDPIRALTAAQAAGWEYALLPGYPRPDQYPAVLACPACVRARTALASRGAT